MKNLAIYFSSPGALDYPLSKINFFESYSEIIEALEKRNVKVGIVRGDSYLGKGQWSSWFKKSGNEFIKMDEIFHSNLIWNKDDKNTIPHILDCPIINPWDFDDICRDKLKTVKMFQEFSAKTILLNSFDDFLKYAKQIESSKIILKPRFGEQSIGVYALEKHEVHPDLYKDWHDILLQELLDSSLGIPGLAPGIHEIKVCMVNGALAVARLKNHPTGRYVAPSVGIDNLKRLSKEEIPFELWEIIEKIDEKLSHFYPRIYRADFLNTKNGFKIIEMNSRPSINHPLKSGPDYWLFNGAIVNAICEFLDKIDFKEITK